MKTIIALSAIAVATSAEPIVKDAIYEFGAYSADGWWGIGGDVSGDIAFGGEWPWWAEQDFMTNKIVAYSKAYAAASFEILLGFFKVGVEGEFAIANAEIDFMTQWELPTYG